MKIKYLDGHRFVNSVIAGALEVFKRKEYLNKINYFPVADSDTGTNITATFRAIVERMKKHRVEKIGDSCKALADAALESAKGNSGVIFAQYFYGFSKAIGNEIKISTEKFGEAVKNAVKYAYEALSNPREGTILSVMRDWSEYVHEQSKKIKDFSVLITNSIEVARKSLISTKEKIEVLRKRNVVDSGAMGFVCFLEGIANFISSGSIKEMKLANSTQDIEFRGELEHMDSEDLQFRWCTECILRGANLDAGIIKMRIKDLGDSIVVAGGKDKLRVHIHTNEPHSVMSLLKSYGEIVYQKADDMLMQYRVAHTSHPDIAVVVDSGCDIPAELIEEYLINVVPVKVSFGDTTFIDRVTITPESLYKMLDGEKDYPTTSQPAPSDFVNLYNFLLAHYESIISIHLPGKLSGTYQNALRASKCFPERRITVIDSGIASAGIGHLAVIASELAYSGKSHDEIVAAVKKARERTQMFVYVDTFKYLMRSGRVSPVKGLLGKVLNVKPILTFGNDGVIRHVGKAFSRRKGLDKLIEHTLKFIGGREVARLTIIHVAYRDVAESVKSKLQRLLNVDEIPVISATPALGVHAGRGAIGIAVTRE